MEIKLKYGNHFITMHNEKTKIVEFTSILIEMTFIYFEYDNIFFVFG